MTDLRNSDDADTDALLRRALETPHAAVPTAECLDAEALAAWTDGALTGQAREAAELHLAGCARCQAVLAVMVRTEPAIAPAPQRPRQWALAWLVPVAAAAAIVVWFAIPAKEALAPMSAPSGTATAANAAPPAQTAAAELRPPASTVAAAEPQSQPAAPAQARAADRLSAKAAAPPVPVAPPPATPERAVGATAANEIVAAPPSVAGGVGAVDTLAKSRAAAQRPAPAAAAPASRDRSVQWRVDGSSVSRSTDGGATWSPVPTAINAVWTAVSAPTAATCWLVGRSGLVALTSDGRTWQRLTSPDAADLSSVQAEDAKIATVTTADGRRFRTTDGGVSWVRLQGIPSAPFYG